MYDVVCQNNYLTIIFWHTHQNLPYVCAVLCPVRLCRSPKRKCSHQRLSFPCFVLLQLFFLFMCLSINRMFSLFYNYSPILIHRIKLAIDLRPLNAHRSWHAHRLQGSTPRQDVPSGWLTHSTFPACWSSPFACSSPSWSATPSCTGFHSTFSLPVSQNRIKIKLNKF